MTTTIWTPVATGGGGASARETVIAEDILAVEGGVIQKRGILALRQNVDNGFPIMRQHVGGTGGHRPAPSIGDYPQGLWLTGTGTDTDGYGAMDSGTGTYLNLGRDREGVWVTQSWWFGIKAPTPADVGAITLYMDTEAWGATQRSYFAAQVNMQTGQLLIRPNGSGDPLQSAGINLNAGTVGVPGWNDNKYDRHYCSLTTFIGKSSATGLEFGRYGAFQMGGKVIDLRSLGGWANYPPSGIAQEGSSFSGGMNPGFGVTSPTAGKSNGVVIYDFALTIGDTL